MAPCDADVAVIGAGPAGAAVALSLARAGHRVLLAECDSGPRLAVGESVGPGIRVALERLGVFDAFLADGHLESLGNMSAWGAPEAAGRDFLFSPYGNGWHLERGRFDATLRRQAQLCGAMLHGGTRLEQLARVAGGWRLRLAGPNGPLDWHTRFVVDATGRRAAVARRCGSARRPLDHLVGVVTYHGAGNKVPCHTLIEAERDGWWYSAPLPQGRLVLVYMTEAGRQRRRTLAGPPRPDSAPLTHARLVRHGGQAEAAAAIVPAYSACLAQAAGADWLAVGDAAASVDPLSSQGIMSALDQALAAAGALAAALGGDPGAMPAYADRIGSMYADYLVQRAHYYRRERRWPDSDFWRQRWADA
ncbi:NAD(P)/FAD-dependent oxidoreductase [Massilia antarctica]|nr:tryptophan 7-halogenase [Massilia antarctica]